MCNFLAFSVYPNHLLEDEKRLKLLMETESTTKKRGKRKDGKGKAKKVLSLSLSSASATGKAKGEGVVVEGYRLSSQYALLSTYIHPHSPNISPNRTMLYCAEEVLQGNRLTHLIDCHWLGIPLPVHSLPSTNKLPRTFSSSSQIPSILPLEHLFPTPTEQQQQQENGLVVMYEYLEKVLKNLIHGNAQKRLEGAKKCMDIHALVFLAEYLHTTLTSLCHYLTSSILPKHFNDEIVLSGELKRELQLVIQTFRNLLETTAADDDNN